MSLTSYFHDHDPFSNFSEFNRLFDDAWNMRIGNRRGETSRDVQRMSDGSGSEVDFVRPRMDLHESKESGEMTATFELPGMKKDEVSIDVQNNRLMISGQSTSLKHHDQDGYSVRERRLGKFCRTLPLPTGTNPENIKASMENGLLFVRFPRTNPEQETKRVTIA
ncbi:HSP20-like chaperone [Hysterangium stoloniferum]|nr:HSP20-like chaperone [Hysterangium stoloniferum]